MGAAIFAVAGGDSSMYRLSNWWRNAYLKARLKAAGLKSPAGTLTRAPRKKTPGTEPGVLDDAEMRYSFRSALWR
jgi:hypothetical protein